MATVIRSAPATPGKVVDVVAVLKAETLAQVFPKARPMRATVYERSRLMEHPLEDGSAIVDHKVADPTEIDLPVMVTGRDELTEVFAEIRDLYDKGTILVVQTAAATYPSMVLMEIPHDEAPETFGGLSVGLRLREARFVKALYGGIPPKAVAGKDKPKASTKKKGAQQTTPATAPQAAKAKEQQRGSKLYQLTHRGG